MTFLNEKREKPEHCKAKCNYRLHAATSILNVFQNDYLEVKEQLLFYQFFSERKKAMFIFSARD